MPVKLALQPSHKWHGNIQTLYDSESEVALRTAVCNVEVPSDWCADTAHGRFMESVPIAPTEGHSVADVLVMWYPQWYLAPSQLHEYGMDGIAQEFLINVIHPCRNLVLWSSSSIQRRRAFGSCMMAATRGFMHQHNCRFEVVVVGPALHTGLFSARLGCVYFNRGDEGDVIMLPFLSGL